MSAMYGCFRERLVEGAAREWFIRTVSIFRDAEDVADVAGRCARRFIRTLNKQQHKTTRRWLQDEAMIGSQSPSINLDEACNDVSLT